MVRDFGIPEDVLLEVVRFCDAKDSQRLLAVNKAIARTVWLSSASLFRTLFYSKETFNLPRRQVLTAIEWARDSKSLQYSKEIFCFACALGLDRFIQERIDTHCLRFPGLKVTSVLNASAADGTPAVVLAALNGHMRTLSLLIDSGANPDRPDKHGRTAAHHACKHSDTVTLGLLIRKEADVTMEDLSGKQCLTLALGAPKSQQRTKCAELIASRLADLAYEAQVRVNHDPWADTEKVMLTKVRTKFV